MTTYNQLYLFPKKTAPQILPLLLLSVAIFITLPSHVLADRKPRPLSLGATGIHVLFHPAWPHTPTAVDVMIIEKGSPADGHGLKIGDRIVGIGEEKFNKHPLNALTEAIDIGEAAGGILTLLLDNGKKAEMHFKDLGPYSPTAPYNCSKTNYIIETSVAKLMQAEFMDVKSDLVTQTALLGLMATGEKKHLDYVTQKIKSCGILNIDPKEIDHYFETGDNIGYSGWTYGYNLILLGEYYLLTKDEAVLPAMKTYALGLARGQDAVGLWGHRFARGKYHRVPGYGIMNQPSLSNFMGLIFAKKCHIEDPVLENAIKTTYAYVADHIDKGGFPYGVHGPSEDIFNNNGTSGSAAICMSLLDNQHGASYFSKITAPTHYQLTYGHASPFFNPLWSPLGASLSGPEVTQRFFKKSLWYFSSVRTWDGGFVTTDRRLRGGSILGQALLTYCLPRHALLITGREADKSIWVKADQAEKLINMDQVDYESLSLEERIELFNSPFPQVRHKVIQFFLGSLKKLYQYNRQNGIDKITPKLVELIEKGNERQKISAISCLGPGTPKTIPVTAELVGSILKNENEPIRVRIAAASVFAEQLVQHATPYCNDILKLVFVKPKEPDPFGHIIKDISRVVADLINNFNKSINDKENMNDYFEQQLKFKVARIFLEHKRQSVREVGVKLLKGLSLENFHIVGDALMRVLYNSDPSYHTYSNILNAEGIGILASLNIKEGLELLEDGIFHGGGKWGFKYGALISALPKYGANAESYISIFEQHKDVNKKGDRFTPQWQKAVKKIRDDEHPAKLISAKEAIEYGKQRSQQP